MAIEARKAMENAAAEPEEEPADDPLDYDGDGCGGEDTTADRAKARVTVDDPWGYGRSLEWATSCPPPRHNFRALPRVRSESPAFDLHHPRYAEHAHSHSPAGGGSARGAASDGKEKHR